MSSDAAVRVRDTSEDEALRLNVLDPAFLNDPYPTYATFRAEAPVHHDPAGFWMIFDYATISEVLADNRFVRAFDSCFGAIHGPERLKERAFKTMSKWMLYADPPEHTRLRKLVAAAFSRRSVEALRPRIRATAQALVDKKKSEGRMDLIWDFAHPLPVLVMSDLLGIPEEDRAQFLEHSLVAARLLDPTPLSDAEMKDANAADVFLYDYFQSLIEQRRNAPGNDLISALVQVRSDDGGLSDDEVISNTMLLFLAGHETTAGAIGNAFLALHQSPDLLDELKRDRSLLSSMANELVRYDTSVQTTARVASEDVAVGGVTIPRGSMVLLSLASGNRDQAQYQRSDQVDPHRAKSKSLSFGGGIHYCLGAQLALIELEVALDVVLTSLPDHKIPNVTTPERRPAFTLRGLTHLPATWPVAAE